MPLAGTFDVLDFGEVLSLLSRRSATGRLQLRTGSMHGVIWLAEGRATAAEIGMSGGGESRSKWRSLLDDICFEALRSTRGSFEFHPEDEVSIPAGPRVRLETLLANGWRRLEMWQEVEAVIHSFEAVPRLADSLTDDSLTLDQDRWKVLVALDGRRTVAALAKRMDIELLEFCRLLKPLVESGAVILEQPEGWLKSLPKVKLEMSGNGSDIDPELVADPGDPGETTTLLSVNSTVVPRSRPEIRGQHREVPPVGSAAAEGVQPTPGAPSAGAPSRDTPPGDAGSGDASSAGPARRRGGPAAPVGGSPTSAGPPTPVRRRLRARSHRPAGSDQ